MLSGETKGDTGLEPVPSDSTPAASRRTLLFPSPSQDVWERRVIKMRDALEQAQTALELAEDGVDEAAIEACTKRRDRYASELRVATDQLLPAAPTLSTSTQGAILKSSLVKYQEYPNAGVFPAFTRECKDVAAWMRQAAIFFDTAQPSCHEVATRALMLTRAMGTPELSSAYSTWLQAHATASWADVAQFLETRVPWQDTAVLAVVEILEWPVMEGGVTAVNLSAYVVRFTNMLAKNSCDTSVSPDAGMLADRKIDGQLSTSFIKLDALFARMLLLKVLPDILATYEVVRASETAAHQKSGQGYLPETLASVCRTLERLHFPKAHSSQWVKVPHAPSFSYKQGGGRGGRGGRGGNGDHGGQSGQGGQGGGDSTSGASAAGEGTPAHTRAKGDGCFNCGKMGHFARDCKEVKAANLNKSQFGKLQVIGNKKSFLHQGLAHQQAGLRLHMVGQPGFAHRAETEARVAALKVEIGVAEEEYSEMLARFGRDNKGKA